MDAPLKIDFSKTLGDLASLFGSHFFAAFVSIFFSIWTTRLLQPADYGLFAATLFLFSVFGWALDFGLEQALLAQKDTNFYAACRTHLAIRLISCLLPIIGFISARLCGFLQGAVSQDVFMLCTIGFMAEKLGSTFKTWLEKKALIKSLAGLEFTSAIGGSLCALLLAKFGFGAKSLAAQWALQRTLLFFGYMFAARIKLTPKIDPAIIKIFFTKFAFPAFLASTFGLCVYDFLPFALLKLSNAAQAGLYARAFSLATMPLMFSAIFGRILNSAVANNIGNNKSLSAWFACLQTAKACFVIPVQLMLMISAHWWCKTIFAARWQGLTPVYLILACYGLFRAFYDDVIIVLTVGFANPWHFCKAQFLQATLILLASVPLIILYGAAGGAVAICLAMVGAVVFFWHHIFSTMQMTLRQFLSLGLTHCALLVTQCKQLLIDLTQRVIHSAKPR